jgi:hypothetical protein
VKVEFRESFTKDLKGLQDKNLLKRAKEVIEAVFIGSCVGEPLKRNVRRLRDLILWASITT